MKQNKNESWAPIRQPETKDIETLGDLLGACNSPAIRRQVAVRMGVSEEAIEAGLSLLYPGSNSDLARAVVRLLEAAGVGVKTSA